jgi:hypothetical protein
LARVVIVRTNIAESIPTSLLAAEKCRANASTSIDYFSGHQR